jgi:hypothetical protein
LELTYSLATGPTNAVIDTNGVITWTPVTAQVPSTNLFTTVVIDSGSPPLSATNTFMVTVDSAETPPQPVIQSITVTNEVVTLTWTASAGRTYRVQYKGNVDDTNWNAVPPDVLATGPTATATNVIGADTQRFYRVYLVPQ